MGRWQGYPKEAKGLLDMANLRYVTYHYSVAPVYIYISTFGEAIGQCCAKFLH